MILKSKICGVSDSETLNYIVNHKYAPQFVGFVCNYPKSKRYVDRKKLKELIKINKNNCLYVAVLVNPDENILKEIKDLPFDYYQLYDCDIKKIISIKNTYNKKIIVAITIENSKDVENYKLYNDVADIFLFDSKGYEKSIGFEHQLLNNIPTSVNKMLAGNIQYNENLDKYSKITDIIDISGSLETSGKKDISKIDIFLKNIHKIKNED